MFRRQTGFERALHHRSTYEHQLERLHARHQSSGGLHRLEQDGVSLGDMVLERRTVARRLARSVASGDYRPEAATRRTITAGRKSRDVYVYGLVDRIVLGAVARLIDEAAAPHRSPQVYSYRPGTSSWDAVADVAAFVRAERRRVADPRDRWTFVLRRDVTSYTDSIPTGPGAPVWEMVRELIGPVSVETWDLIEHTIRPEVLVEGALTRPERGLPLGQPISGVIANLYLHDLDRRLESIPEVCYARYGDDMLLAHRDPDIMRGAAEDIDEHLARLGLSANADKDANFVLTSAGRSSPDWPGAHGVTAIGFLGAEIRAAGTVALDRDKARRLVREVATRAQRTNAALGDADLDSRGRAVCAAVNRALDPDAPASHQQTSSPLVSRVVTDRGQLADLDHRIADAVIAALIGDHTARARRQLPYRTLRETWGLVSLEHVRNRAARRSAEA